MPVGTAQAIAGVSASRETEIEAVYPSVAANFLGQLIGMIMGAVNGIPITPIRIIGMVVVGLFLFPLALLIYVLMKAAGQCYVLTNQSIQARTVMSRRLISRIALSEVAEIDITQAAGYEFHRVGDVNLRNAQGNVLMRIPAIQFPERLRHIILDARDARISTDESLQHIQGRAS